MHKAVIPHEFRLTDSTLDCLLGLNFVFICIDDGEVKKPLIETLLKNGISFIDVGIGINVVDGLLLGSSRITLGTKDRNKHIEKTISFASGNDGDIYDANIQIAEINALNAALAVIKWKKLYNIYIDQQPASSSVYDIAINKLLNHED